MCSPHPTLMPGTLLRSPTTLASDSGVNAMGGASGRLGVPLPFCHPILLFTLPAMPWQPALQLGASGQRLAHLLCPGERP